MEKIDEKFTKTCTLSFNIPRFWVLVLKYSPITRFFAGPKNRVKGGVPV